MSTGILIAAGYPLVREGVRSLIAAHTDLALVAEARTAAEAERALQEQAEIDVAVIDAVLDGVDGAILTCRRATSVNVGTVVVAANDDVRTIQRVLKAGAGAYVLMGSALRELVPAVRTVAQKQTYLSQSINEVIIRDYVRALTIEDASPVAGLSARERRVLELIAHGRSTKAIAADLSLSIRTIAAHRQSIMLKLGLSTTAELVKFSISEGLISLDR
jgi:DNA-binding NarL/FixJ family response regulator